MVRRGVLCGLALVLGLCGCGGGGGGSGASGGGGGGGGGSNGMGGINWPSRGGETSKQLPPVVKTGRVVFESQSGESCCVAVDASVLSGGSREGLAILTDLSPGPATVTVAGFATDFAPTVPGILATCATIPPQLAHACDPVQAAAPAFESDPLAVTIVAGAQTNLETVPEVAKPFVLNSSPAQDATVAQPVQFALTVVDAVTGISSDSVALEVQFTVPAAPSDTTPSPFRSLSKRVPLTLTACADGGSTPCSASGNLQLAGFAAAGTAPELPEGEVDAHITAENLGTPPQQLDLVYPFTVLATATGSATATSTATATETATPTSTMTATSTATTTVTPNAESRSNSAAPIGAGVLGSNGAGSPKTPTSATLPTPTVTPVRR